MRRIAPSRNEILMRSRHQSALLAISLMKDYLFIARNCVTSTSLAADVCACANLREASTRGPVVGLHVIRNDGCERIVCQKYLISRTERIRQRQRANYTVFIYRALFLSVVDIKGPF